MLAPNRLRTLIKTHWHTFAEKELTAEITHWRDFASACQRVHLAYWITAAPALDINPNDLAAKALHSFAGSILAKELLSKILLHHQSTALLQTGLQALISLREEQYSLVESTITASQPLSGADITQLQKIIHAKFNWHIQPNLKIIKDFGLGFSLQVKDWFIDASLRGKISQLKQLLNA